MRFFRILNTLTLAAAAIMPMTALASGGGGEEHHGVDAKALPIFKIGAFEFTNSFLMAIIAAVLIAWFVENIVGKKVAPRAFPLLGSIFVFILVSNYMGLFPGVGTVGFGPDGHSVSQPFFRPSTADMNMTLAIALVSTVIWFWLSIAELGVGGFLAHTFGPKGGLKGALKYGLMPIFFIVGLIEVVGFCFRPVSLSFRLYGNIFAGENLLHTMSGLMDKTGPVGKFIGACALPIPFYFMELLVGLLQAMVFTLLMAVYIQLSTTHEDHGDHGHEEGHDDHGHGEKAAAH
jgi:F-type H+-transporting ATPase subunit a